MTFDPQALTPEASVNRVLVDGRLAVDLLSAAATRDLDAEEVGCRVGALVATLRHAGAAEQATSRWRRAWFQHWQTIDKVWLGGGLAARFGRPMTTVAHETATALGAGCAVDLAPEPDLLSLRGAAMTAARGDGLVVTLDFGHSLVKRGVASFADGELIALDALPAVAVALAQDSSSAEEVRDFLIEQIRGALDGRQVPVRASIASYVVDGRPADNRGAYGKLSPDLWDHLADVDLEFIHDGTAAARALPTGKGSAVIVMGTFLCAGFAP